MPRREPARDDHGFVLPHDHAEILDDHYVLRHIPPLWLHDDNGTVRGQRRIF